MSESDGQASQANLINSKLVDQAVSSKIEQLKKQCEQEEKNIQSIKQQSEKIVQNVGKDASAGAGKGNYQWQETDQSDKKGQFSFFHLIIVAILCLILGSYLAGGLGQAAPQKEL